MNGNQLWNLVQGLQESDLLQYTHLLTGYIGSVSFLETIVKIISLLRERNPDLIYGEVVYLSSHAASHGNLGVDMIRKHPACHRQMYGLSAVCDPVMGDNGKLYVSKELVPAYRDQIISLATVLTPNQYEAEVLTGIKIDSKKSALQACQALHDRGVATVVSFASLLLIFRQWSAAVNASLRLESS